MNRSSKYHSLQWVVEVMPKGQAFFEPISCHGAQRQSLGSHLGVFEAMIVGGYTLDLYCDGPCIKSNPDGSTKVSSYFANNEREARRMAKTAGWKFVFIADDGMEYCYCRDCRHAKAAETAD